MQILLVEDNALLNHHLSSQLVEDGHIVHAETTASAGLQTIRKQPCDVAIIDIGLPDFDGLRLIKQIRSGGLPTPILILTARSSWQDKVEGLDAGADDYLVKPFQMEELTARLHALVRRSVGFTSPTVNAGNITVDLNAKTVSIDAQLMNLTGFEYGILEHLIKNRQKVVSKQQLADAMYKISHDAQVSSIEVIISRLRKKLASFGHDSVIATIRGQGYLFKLGAE